MKMVIHKAKYFIVFVLALLCFLVPISNVKAKQIESEVVVVNKEVDSSNITSEEENNKLSPTTIIITISVSLVITIGVCGAIIYFSKKKNNLSK